MLSNKVQSALNAQINAEFWSAYLYLSMACHFDAEGKPGIANWFRIQFQEEQAHAQIFMNYVNARAGRVELKPIDLYALAEAEHDYATRDQLNWFVKEQVEEEDTARQLIDKFKLIGNDGMGQYMLDQELASRVYNVPSPLAQA